MFSMFDFSCKKNLTTVHVLLNQSEKIIEMLQ